MNTIPERAAFLRHLYQTIAWEYRDGELTSDEVVRRVANAMLAECLGHLKAYCDSEVGVHTQLGRKVKVAELASELEGLRIQD